MVIGLAIVPALSIGVEDKPVGAYRTAILPIKEAGLGPGGTRLTARYRFYWRSSFISVRSADPASSRWKRKRSKSVLMRPVRIIKCERNR